ncbi:hypothetical protein CAL27_20130 [Bordetella genomosp. 1]|uniref:Transposase n=1 Tax=Bordetella genomosp. 1 TaxID=1395607 RepID=A0ABX4EWZ7_9BORD|nr:hypothetical protein CAL27_20130 [Bordetella genomosp. 1]
MRDHIINASHQIEHVFGSFRPTETHRIIVTVRNFVSAIGQLLQSDAMKWTGYAWSCHPQN